MRGCVPERVGSRPSHRAGNGQKKFFLNKKKFHKSRTLSASLYVYIPVYTTVVVMCPCVWTIHLLLQGRPGRDSLLAPSSPERNESRPLRCIIFVPCARRAHLEHTHCYFLKIIIIISSLIFFSIVFCLFFFGFLRMNSKIINFALLFYWLFSPDIVSNENI